MKFGTDPVAIDRLLIDIIDDKRKKEGVDLGLESRHEVLHDQPEDWERDPNMNRSIREPGHIEYASTLGLGVYDLAKSTTRRSRYDRSHASRRGRSALAATAILAGQPVGAGLVPGARQAYLRDASRGRRSSSRDWPPPHPTAPTPRRSRTCRRPASATCRTWRAPPTCRGSTRTAGASRAASARHATRRCRRFGAAGRRRGLRLRRRRHPQSRIPRIVDELGRMLQFLKTARAGRRCPRWSTSASLTIRRR